VPPERQRVEVAQKDFYLKHTDNIKDHYNLHETIGEGALSRVRRATHKLSKVIRAIKVVRKEDLEFGERKKLLDEIEMLKELDHPNIGRVIEMFED
jgi:calcium-dependent protein kinase